MDYKEKIKVFDKELSLIEDGNVKKLTKECIKLAEEWFFIEPASSSGKYHPDFAREAGGLILHTKAVVYFLTEILRSELYKIDSYHKDLLILSAIIHDIKKYGEKNNTGHTVKNHADLASKFVEDVNNTKKDGIIPKNDLEYVKKCVERHMGVFGDSIPETDDEKLLHIADLIASRKEIDLKFSKDEKKKALPSLDEYKVDFGMHIGKTLREVPIDYLKWAVENVDKKPVFRSLAKQLLKENSSSNGDNK